MKITTPLTATVATATNTSGFNNTNNPVAGNTTKIQAPAPVNRLDSKPDDAEQVLTNRIGQERGGKDLIKFCRELSIILIRSYQEASGDDGNIGEMSEKLAASLMVTLNCTQKQALCLIELSLELIHAKLHGRYKRSEVELNYLIATATGAVCDVSSN